MLAAACVECGRAFVRSDFQPRALTCSKRCNQRRWRARTMLAGTHGYVNGQFARLKEPMNPDDFLWHRYHENRRRRRRMSVDRVLLLVIAACVVVLAILVWRGL